MNYNELMIGDILDLSDVHNEIIPCKVVELHTDELYVIQPNDTACDIVGYDMVRPIPLTTEILEKNGWYHDGIFMERRANENIQLSWTDRCGAILYKNSYEMCDCNYVHELQHALRLCGLNDLANNFKL